MKKKIISFMLALCFIIPCAITLSACNKGKDDVATKVMNVSLNPELEFILDNTNKVISVNALNEDGNHIISISIDSETAISAFKGLTAEEAINLFLQITEENGYLITGNEEEIKIEISGKADNLMKKVKDKAQAFFNENNLYIDIETDSIDKSDLVEEVKNCMKEFTESELNNMSQEELINLLKESRNETANLLTQELKDAYYNLRLEEINVAEFEALLDLVEDLTGHTSTLLDTFEENMSHLTSKMGELEEAYATYFLSEESAFNEAKQAYINAKEELLAKRLELDENGISEAEKLILEEYESAVENAENALNNAKASAENAINEAKLAVNEIINSIKSSIAQIESILKALGVNLESIDNARQNVKNDFKDHFEQHEDFSGHIGHNKSNWGK